MTWCGDKSSVFSALPNFMHHRQTLLDSLFQVDLDIFKLNENFLIDTLCVCSYHVTYAFQSESTLYSCLNVKELFAWNRCQIWSLSDCNGTRTHNHLVHKRTLNHLAKLAKRLSCAYDCMLSCHVVYKLSGCGFECHCSHLIHCCLEIPNIVFRLTLKYLWLLFLIFDQQRDLMEV